MAERWKGHLVLFTGINIDLANSNLDSACTCIFLGPAYRFENSCKDESGEPLTQKTPSSDGIATSLNCLDFGGSTGETKGRHIGL